MSSNYISVKEIYEHTDSGFEIIKAYHPDADKNNPKKKFKIRDERTPSANLYFANKTWFVKDFGGGKAMNAIDVVMNEENVTFKEALHIINERFLKGKLNGKTCKSGVEPKISKVKAPNNYIIEFKDKFSEFELKTLGKFVTEKVCTKYHLKPVKYYINPKGYKFEATDRYPIYCFDYGTWKKIYQPLSQKKEYRFFYVGNRPKNFIFGLEQLLDEYDELKEKISEQFTDEDDIEEVEQVIKSQLKDVIICSGDRDALNVASLGYNVVWLNSETSKLPIEQYKTLKRISKQIYNVPDIDKTGVRQAYHLALQYLDIINIWLPDELQNFKDFRGNACKDVTDFIAKFRDAKSYFDKLKNVSTPLQFWSPEYDKGGNLKKYNINVTAFYEFLKANGFYRLEDKSNKNGYIYIRIDNNVVERIEPDRIKNYVKDFVNAYLEKNLHPIALRNTFYKSRQTDEPYLSNLPLHKNIDFKDFDKDYQYWFFPNVAWKITKDEIFETKLADIDRYVWKTDIKDKTKKVKKINLPLIEIDYTKEYLKTLKSGNKKEIDKFPDIDKYELKINDKDFIFIRYLVNTSKIYWKKEEEGIELTKTEQKEQILHFINKIYALGYLAHKHKIQSKAWAVFAMDARESDIGQSFGGSGKSIFMNCIEYINKTFYIGGRNPHKTKDNFIFDGVDEYTFNINIDDADQYFDFDFFFPIVTGKMNVNPKNNKPFTLSFEESPKLGITSNFTLRKLDPSTERRILYTAFSDYYHKKDNEGYYIDTRTPDKEFGKNLFTDFSDEEWNKFYNLLAIAIQVYMKFEKIEPPMNKVEKRNLMTQIGQGVLDWANEYFLDNDKLNTEVSKSEMYQDFQNNVSLTTSKHINTKKFKDKIKLYCKYRDWVFNPPDKCNNGNRIMRK
ncbi:MAG: hypothetical protein GXO49_02695, partial [Chlorobi bacterium]|nr:hypothetical protein [Chlorobiota bacterium]